MPRGSSPNSRKNLISNSERTPKERKKQAQKAGIASGEVRAAYASLRESLKERCTPERMARMNERLISMAEHGNIAAWRLIMQALGEDPAQKIEVTGADGGPLLFAWEAKDE